MFNGIPKIIMQTWKTKEIPEKWKKSPISIQKYMKDWKYILLTDKDNSKFVKKYFPDFYETFKNFPYEIQKADAIRYMFLYVKGGIYMDLDHYLKKSLEKLITNKITFMEYESVNGIMFTNSFIISPKRHPFWLKVIREMKKPVPFYCIIKSQIVYESTGPYMLSRVIRKQNVDKKKLKMKKMKKYLGQLEGQSWHGPIEKIGVFFTNLLGN